jgi:hypothetical protein
MITMAETITLREKLAFIKKFLESEQLDMALFEFIIYENEPILQEEAMEKFSDMNAILSIALTTYSLINDGKINVKDGILSYSEKEKKKRK